jgi:hypothetical protein
MTVNQEIATHTALAAVVEGVPGVAFLKPGLAGRLRSTFARGGAAPPGVRLTRPEGDGPWHVEIQVVALRQARTVEVARAVRAAVEHHPATPVPARVTVTVTGIV